MIIDSHAHVSPGYDRRGDWDFDTDPELWAYHYGVSANSARRTHSWLIDEPIVGPASWPCPGRGRHRR